MLSGWVEQAVPMSEGNPLALDLRIHMSGELQVSGADGPLEEEGVPWGSHLNTECSTQNWWKHQAWRRGGTVTGTIDGTDVSTLFLEPHAPFVEGHSVFTGIVTEHGFKGVE